MSTPPSKPARKHLRASDLRGVVQLAAQATTGASRIAEGVHQSVWSTLGVAGGKGGGGNNGKRKSASRASRFAVAVGHRFCAVSS